MPVTKRRLAGIFISIKKDNMIKKEDFHKVIDGKQVSLYTLYNSKGLKLSVTNFGARVIELWTPDKDNNYKDIVLGYDSIDKYLHNKGERFLGAVCGRFANRINKGQFHIDGKEYHLPINNNGQTLHGGLQGLDSVIWEVTFVNDTRIVFKYISPDMEEGFPGTLSIEMCYELTDENEFKITYKAQTDQPTPVNLTHHSFFNLKGEGTGSINDHILQINGSSYLPVDSVLIPLGKSENVADTPMDFLRPATIGSRLDNPFSQLKIAGGYDHCWVLNKQNTDKPELAATVWEPASGRLMEVWTDQPGLQFYGGNFFDGKTLSKSGDSSYEYRGAFALETQHFPDSPNQTSFPSTLLMPDNTYSHICIYKFSVKA